MYYLDICPFWEGSVEQFEADSKQVRNYWEVAGNTSNKRDAPSLKNLHFCIVLSLLQRNTCWSCEESKDLISEWHPCAVIQNALLIA